MRIVSRCSATAALILLVMAVLPWGCGRPIAVTDDATPAAMEVTPDTTASRPPVVLPPSETPPSAGDNTPPLAPVPITPEKAEPPAEPAVSESPPKPAEEPKPPEIPEQFAARLRQIKDGMTYEQVVSIIGPPAFTVSGAGTDTVIYQWSGDGAKFAARFEKNRLTRKSGVKSAGDDTEQKPSLSQEQYDAVKEGMTLEDVTALLHVEAQRITDKGPEYSVYKWMDEAGSSFTARFEKGKLVRKTGFYVAPLKKEGENEAGAEGEADTAAEEDTEQSPPPEPAAPAEEVQDVAPETEPAPQDSEQANPPEQTPVPVRESKVRVLGAARREKRIAQEPPEIAGRSYKPKAKLPEFTYSLRRGAFEVRIHNEGDAAARVGIRKENRGKDTSIGAGSVKSFYVDQGTYNLYYLFSNEPYTLQKGPSITIDGWFLSDVEVFVRDESASANE